MTSYVKDLVITNGGENIVVIGIPDFNVSPYGVALNETEMLGSLCEIFNEELQSQENRYSTQQFNHSFGIEVINPTRLFNMISNLGFENVGTPACDQDKISAFLGEPTRSEWSFWCNTAEPYFDLANEASVSSWFWADDVHLTTGGHQLLSEALWNQLRNVRSWVA